MIDGRQKQISYEGEIARKVIHLSSLAIPVIYLNINHTAGIAILTAMTVVSVLIDVARHFHKPSRRFLLRFVGDLLRKHERDNGRFRLTGATWVLIAATLTLGVFPTIVGVTAFTVLIVSDTFAALVGRKYGEKKFLDKSAVGTATFVLTACAVVAAYGIIYAMPWTYWVAGVVGGVCGAIVEAGSVRLNVDDNIVVPFSTAITMMILDWALKAVGASSFLYLVS